MRVKRLIILLFILSCSIFSCESLQDPPIDKKHTPILIRITGNATEASAKSFYDPAVSQSLYEEVNIDLLVVGAIVNDSLHSLFTNAGSYNLLEYTGGNDTLIASKSLPVGYLSQIRLLLSNNNSVKVNGEYYYMKAPSAYESGLKLNVQREIYYDSTYTFILDFDPNKSITKAGNKYLLKPVIKVNTITIPDTTKSGNEPLY